MMGGGGEVTTGTRGGYRVYLAMGGTGDKEVPGR